MVSITGKLYLVRAKLVKINHTIKTVQFYFGKIGKKIFCCRLLLEDKRKSNTDNHDCHEKTGFKANYLVKS